MQNNIGVETKMIKWNANYFARYFEENHDATKEDLYCQL